MHIPPTNQSMNSKCLRIAQGLNFISKQKESLVVTGASTKFSYENNLGMSSIRELKDAIKETLLKSGALAEIRARIRAEVFHMLQEDSELPPVLSNENIIINDLIREYLIYNGYLFTESVLLAESGQPQLQIQRNLIEEQLRIKSNKEGDLPLLYGLISYASKEDKPSENIIQASEKR